MAVRKAERKDEVNLKPPCDSAKIIYYVRYIKSKQDFKKLKGKGTDIRSKLKDICGIDVDDDMKRIDSIPEYSKKGVSLLDR